MKLLCEINHTFPIMKTDRQALYCSLQRSTWKLRGRSHRTLDRLNSCEEHRLLGTGVIADFYLTYTYKSKALLKLQKLWIWFFYTSWITQLELAPNIFPWLEKNSSNKCKCFPNVMLLLYPPLWLFIDAKWLRTKTPSLFNPDLLATDNKTLTIL